MLLRSSSGRRSMIQAGIGEPCILVVRCFDLGSLCQLQEAQPVRSKLHHTTAHCCYVNAQYQAKLQALSHVMNGRSVGGRSLFSAERA